MVALYHWPVVSALTGPDFFLPNAQMLMDFFFVLSGFIISASSGQQLASWGDFKTFVLRRFARLWPLHAAVLAAFVAIELAKALLAPHAGKLPPFTETHAPLAIVSNLLLIHSLHLHSMLTWNAPSWTVSVEFYTYFVFGVLTITAPRWRNLWSAALALVGFLGVAFVARQLAATYDYGVFRCFYGFFCGVLTWRLWSSHGAGRAWSPRLATAIEAASLIGVFAYISLWGGAPGGYAGPLIFSLFVWIWASDQGAVAGFFAQPSLVRLGEISYSIYLVHYLIVVMISLALRSVGLLGQVDYTALGITGVEDISFVRFSQPWIADMLTAAYLVAVVVTAGFTYRWIEQPGRRLFARKPARTLTRLSPIGQG